MAIGLATRTVFGFAATSRTVFGLLPLPVRRSVLPVWFPAFPEPEGSETEADPEVDAEVTLVLGRSLFGRTTFGAGSPARSRGRSVFDAKSAALVSLHFLTFFTGSGPTVDPADDPQSLSESDIV